MHPQETPESLRQDGERLAHSDAWGPQPPAWHTTMVQADHEAEARLLEDEQRGEYTAFLNDKKRHHSPSGFNAATLNQLQFDWQRRITSWCCERGRAAIFADCGLGKTVMQLDWAHQVQERNEHPVLILAPLAVGKQTEQEARKFGWTDPKYFRTADDVEKTRVVITNYERLDRFAGMQFSGIVLDESSILKAIDGKTRVALTAFSKDIPYKLCCTATPSPNDHMELGNHAEFLGVLSASEMLAMYFVHDGGETSKWRLKKHARRDFWHWVCSWAISLAKPSDIGGDDNGFDLPTLEIYQVEVESTKQPGDLFVIEASTLDERRAARRESLQERVSVCAKMVNNSDEPWVIWCNLNAESAALTSAIPDAVEVKGPDSAEQKEAAMMGFSSGEIRVLVTKPRIAGFGMNWQHCAKVAFVGLSDSYEQFYQAIRRCWRFGQARQVDCYVITSEAEGAVVRNIERKEKQAMERKQGMVSAMQHQHELGKGAADVAAFSERETTDLWTMIHGDCVEETRKIESNSIDFSVFSPPFASLYTYTDKAEDMGNTKTHDEFFDHLGFLIPELLRVTKPGRLLSFHCMNLPRSKQFDGVIGLRDFRGRLIGAFEKAGWIFHSEVCIWKDPVTAMQRTKALGLLWKQIKKDSSMSRQGIADYLVTMRKPGENREPITHSAEEFPVEQWQRWASPVWMDINPSDTLQRTSAREQEDERHICPLQLEVIRRSVRLWSNPNDLVFSPFAGIGSEGYEAVKCGRRFIGVELKESYFEQACRNLKSAVQLKDQARLDFGMTPERLGN